MNSLSRNDARKIEPEELEKIAQAWGPATQVFYAWLARKTACDWLNEESLDSLARANKVGLVGATLTIHHIYPRKLAAENLSNPNDVNCLANFAIVSRETNSKFNDTPPNEVLETLSARQRGHASVQLFGQEAGDRLNRHHFDEFRAWRAKRLSEEFNKEFWISRRKQ